MSQIILQGYVTSNLTATQGYVGSNATPPDPPDPPPPTYFAVAVASTVGGSTDPDTGTYNILTTETLTVTETPTLGYHFLYWLLDSTGAGSNSTIIVSGVEDQQRTLLAVFAEDPPDPPTPVTTYTVTVVEGENGHASLGTGTHIYDSGTQITLTAIPDNGYMFASWLVNATVYTTSTITLTITANCTVTPLFTALPTSTLPGALTLANLWTNLLAKIQAQGVNTAATIHTLELGADDGVTGQPSKYWTDVASDMIINPDGVELQHFNTGIYGKLAAKGFTAAQVSDGDEVTDSYGNCWAIVEVVPYKIGGYKQCTLNLKLESNFTHPPNPSEITKTLEFTVLNIDNVYNLCTVEFTVLTVMVSGQFFTYTFPVILA